MGCIELCLRDRNANDAVVAWLGGYSEDDIERLLLENPNWYRSSAFFN